MVGRGACAAAGVTGADGGAVNSGVVGAAGAGFGAGLGPGVGREPCGAGVTGVTGALGAAGAAGRSATAGLGAGGRGAAGRADCAGEGAPGLGAALRGAPGLALLPPWKASVNLRTTGASIVEDADRTNSPSSWSLAMTALLSTPNSLASSYTRTLATSLLLGPGCGRTVATSWAYSSRAHRVLIAISTYFQLAGGTRAARWFRATRLTVLPARRTGATPPCRALPGHAVPLRTPGDVPPGRDRPGRGAHTHPGRAAYRDDRGRIHPRSPRCAADPSWPLAPDTPHRCVQGIRGLASGQTLLSLPPRTDLTHSR